MAEFTALDATIWSGSLRQAGSGVGCIALSGVYTRHTFTYQVRSFAQLPGRDQYSLATLCVSARIVRRTPSPPGSIEYCELGRAYTPIAPFLPRHDMEMKVRGFLPAVNPVVLEREYPEGTPDT